jgi:hypothetical protein
MTDKEKTDEDEEKIKDFEHQRLEVLKMFENITDNEGNYYYNVEYLKKMLHLDNSNEHI